MCYIINFGVFWRNIPARTVCMMEIELPPEFEDDKDAQQALEDYREIVLEIENVKNVETEFTVEIGDESTKFSMAFTVAEIDGKWYLWDVPSIDYAE